MAGINLSTIKTALLLAVLFLYTRLSTYQWKFEQPNADFEAVIIVDDDGFVVDYPGLFTRENTPA